tara:strand:- start:268 stop:1353 length:1086 start_codon:yes stop_codon:yes gene_type:complete
MISWDGGRCYTCTVGTSTCSGSESTAAECGACAGQWGVATFANCDENEYGCEDLYTTAGDCPTYVADGDVDDGWVPFVSDGDDLNGEEVGGDPTECSCTAAGAALNAELTCPALGDLNGDGGYNVLDIVALANCVLAGSCADLENGCAGDLNGDGGYNVLDIVSLANCVLAGNCGGRVDDATASSLTITDKLVSIEADGFIGGVQMTISHDDNFSIDMTDRALFSDYLTTDSQTRLLVINPETEDLFTYDGQFEIVDIMVANTQYEVSVELPLAASFSLSEAYPNPFNPTTTMTLTMPISGDVNVEVYNVLGQVVATLASGYMDASTYTLSWDASEASSGLYFVKATAEGFTKTQKLMLLK